MLKGLWEADSGQSKGGGEEGVEAGVNIFP